MLDTLEIETAPHPTASIIVLHGLGADGHDFVPLAQEFSLGAVGPVRYLFPHAPKRPVTINGGYVMRAWYDIFGIELELGVPRREDADGLEAARLEIEALIARERSRGIASSRIVLAGFSQGCAMTLMTGLRHTERLAGLLGMSGYLPLATRTEAERHPANIGLPVFLGHGSADPVIPVQRAIDSREALLALGYPVQWRQYPMPHSVCAEEIADMNAWLLDVLSR